MLEDMTRSVASVKTKYHSEELDRKLSRERHLKAHSMVSQVRDGIEEGQHTTAAIRDGETTADRTGRFLGSGDDHKFESAHECPTEATFRPSTYSERAKQILKKQEDRPLEAI
jgi:hypothetical protein